MPNNDTYPYASSETFAPSAAAGVTDGKSITPQATRMGLIVECALSGADPLDGNYTVIVETAVSGEPAGGEWQENSADSVTFNAVGVYDVQLTVPVFDKVRARVETDATNPGRAALTLRWLCDQSLTDL